jgi:hypothetical protein
MIDNVMKLWANLSTLKMRHWCAGLMCKSLTARTILCIENEHCIFDDRSARTTAQRCMRRFKLVHSLTNVRSHFRVPQGVLLYIISQVDIYVVLPQYVNIYDTLWPLCQGDSLSFSLGSCSRWWLRLPTHFILIEGLLHIYIMCFSTFYCGLWS